MRWLKRSDERRVARGQKSWTHPKLRKALTSRGAPSQPIGGDIWPVAIYWGVLAIGSNKALFPAAIDSGSFVLAVPLKGCDGCTTTPPNNAYVPTSSNTSFKYSCSLTKSCVPAGTHCDVIKRACVEELSYQTCVPTDPNQVCSIKDMWFQDQVSWAGSPSVPVQFGAIYYQTSNFEQFQTVSGVVGMAGPNNPQSVIGQLASGGAVDAWKWSICLQQGGVSNGTLTLGGVDDRLRSGPVQYTEDVGGGQFYAMQLNSIGVGNSNVPVSVVEEQVIIDSGTNIVLLPDETYTSMKQSFLSLCSSVNLHGICDVSQDATLFDGSCYTFTQQQLNAFPNVTFTVPNINLVLQPSNYILKNYGTNFQPGQYCLGIDNTGPGGLQIVGDTLMENYLTVFDLQNQQIGWAPVSSKCGNLSH